MTQSEDALHNITLPSALLGRVERSRGDIINSLRATEDLVRQTDAWRVGDLYGASGPREVVLHLKPNVDGYWIQWLAHWYTQMAFLPTGARIAVLKTIDASEWAKRRILLAGVCRDVTAPGRLSQAAPADTFVYPLIH
jgi:hypothetical protein